MHQIRHLALRLGRRLRALAQFGNQLARHGALVGGVGLHKSEQRSSGLLTSLGGAPLDDSHERRNALDLGDDGPVRREGCEAIKCTRCGLLSGHVAARQQAHEGRQSARVRNAPLDGRQLRGQGP